MLKLQDVSVHYDGVQALWDVSLEVGDGEVVALVGANGAGKTTTLRTISRLLPLSSGSIELDGRRLDRAKPHQVVTAGVAHVPEGRQLFPMMTVRENLDMGAFLPEAKRNREQMIQRIFELFPILAERQHQLAGTLSGGEQQMLAIGRGLMLRPKVLMLDEPSLGLAPKLVAEIFNIVREINSDGMTVLLVEQNVGHALALASTAYVLENGRVALHGPAGELANNPHVRRAYLGL